MESFGVSKINQLLTVLFDLLSIQQIHLEKNRLTVPIKLFSIESGRMLNISEYMEHSYNTTDKYVQAGIKNVRSWS